MHISGDFGVVRKGVGKAEWPPVAHIMAMMRNLLALSAMQLRFIFGSNLSNHGVYVPKSD